jgi:peptidoglycan-associated lipoprotein
MGEGNIPVAGPGSELKDVNFAFDSSSLDSRAQSVLRANSQWLLDNPGRKVVIEGHCDERGTNEYNLALGERRARATFDFLRSLGVKADNMSTISYGEELPLDPGQSEDAWSKNRRAHFSMK